MIYCPEEHKKGCFKFFLFLSLKRKEKIKQNRVCPWGGNKNEFCIEKVELLQLCFTSPLVYFPFIVFRGDRESSQCVLCQGGLQGLHLLLGCQCHNARGVESLQSFCCLSEQLAGSLQLKAKSKLLLGFSWDKSVFPLFSFFLLHT